MSAGPIAIEDAVGLLRHWAIHEPEVIRAAFQDAELYPLMDELVAAANRDARVRASRERARRWERLVSKASQAPSEKVEK